MSTNEKWSFLSNKSLENKIQKLEEKLNKKQLTLGYRMKNNGHSRAINLRVCGYCGCEFVQDGY